MANNDYAMYLPADSAALRSWDITVTAAGFTRIRRGTAYPPRRHPIDHHFNWNAGRILSCHQIIYITGGSGQFESAATGAQPVTEGSFFILMPGVWHRYRPDARTGWVEHWLELVGPVMDRLQQHGVLRSEKALLHLGHQPHLVELFEQCHHAFRDGGRIAAGVVGTLGVAILAQALDLAASIRPANPVDAAINHALILMSEVSDRPLPVEQLARHLKVDVSRFRRAFAHRTGLSPKRYAIQMRLRRVQDLLLNTPLRIEDIAQQLGFSSAFHLSKQFRQLVGVSPTQWRKQQ